MIIKQAKIMGTAKPLLRGKFKAISASFTKEDFNQETVCQSLKTRKRTIVNQESR